MAGRSAAAAIDSLPAACCCVPVGHQEAGMPDDVRGKGVIEVRLREIAQLFNSLDPSPFHERDLDDDAEAYIVNWARQLDDDVAIELVVHLPDPETQKARDRDLATALGNYFSYRAGGFDGDLKELLHDGRRHLLVGLSLLTVCLIMSRFVGAEFGGPIAALIEQSLIIVGWVANWKPLEIFLYDWWPIARRRNLYRRLAAADVRIVSQP